VTSQSPNKTNELRLPFGQQAIDTNYTLIDLPGHPKLEYLTTAEIKGNRNNLLGIIYVVDAASGPDTVAQAAKGLLSILTLTEKRAGGVDILVAANKSDVFNVLSSSRLQKMLEDQIQQLRETSAKGLGHVDADEDELDRSWVGGDQKFEFDHLEGNVTVLSGSVLGDATTKWEGWVEETALNH
jgi:signal recognition particle receptor subunit beta